MKALDSRLRRHQQGGRGRLPGAGRTEKDGSLLLFLIFPGLKAESTKPRLFSWQDSTWNLSRGPQGPTAAEALAPLRSVSTHPRSTDTVTETTKVFDTK